jgi:hypothetical protein
MRRFLSFFFLLFLSLGANASGRGSLVASKLGFSTLTRAEYRNAKNCFIKDAIDGGFLKEGEDGLSLYRAASVVNMQESYKEGIRNQFAFDDCVASYMLSGESSREFMREKLADCDGVMEAVEDVCRGLQEEKTVCCTIL